MLPVLNSNLDTFTTKRGSEQKLSILEIHQKFMKLEIQCGFNKTFNAYTKS